jgi:hypothetical protein
MTIFRPLPTSLRPAMADNVVPFAPRTPRPERDFGTGYGRSSGYAAARSYTTSWAPPRFRCA